MNILKKAGFFLVAVLGMLQLAGCGKKEEEATQTVKPEDDYVYVTDFKSLYMEGYYTGNMIIGDDDTVYMTGNTPEGNGGLFSMKPEDAAPQVIPFPMQDGGYFSGIGKDGKGNILAGVLRSSKEENGKTEAVILYKLTTQGEIIETVDATAALAKIKDFYIGNLLTDDEGNYYLSSNQSIYVLNPAGDLLCEMAADGYISSMFTVKDGRILAAYYGNAGWRLQEASLAQKALTDIESGIPFEYGTYKSGRDTDLIYTQDTFLYTANLKDEQPVKILNWVDSDISSNNLQDFKLLEDGRILAVTNEVSAEDSRPELAVLTKKKRSEVPEKKILTYAALVLPYFTNQDIVAFNKQSDEYRIEIKEYGDDNTDIETKISRLSADLASGNGPDIIDLFYNFIPLEDYLNMGALEDLTPYLEKDEILSREDFVESVMEAYEADGGLYAIMSGFGVRTLAGRVSDVGTNKSWTIDEMIALVDSKPEDIEIIPYSSKNSVLNLMFSLNAEKFIDKETGECSFTGEEFEKILTFANRFPSEMVYDANDASEIEKIRSGRQLLSDTTLTSVQLYQMYEYMFDEEVNFIGYPTVGESGSSITPYGTTVGMNAKSENKEGVWEFIRFNLMEERQKNQQSYSSSFPIMKTALDDKLKKDMTAEYYEDEEGNQKEKAKGVWGQGDFSVEVFAATPEQVERVKAIIDSANSGKSSDSKITEIINEEAQAYFDGQRSVEDVAALIQNRVQVYVNEKR